MKNVYLVFLVRARKIKLIFLGNAIRKFQF